MTNKTESDTKGAQYTTVAQIEMDGRILFDMQKEIMKGHNLESYKLDTVSNYYKEENSNVHRGVHHLSQIATDYFEESRSEVKKFIN